MLYELKAVDAIVLKYGAHKSCIIQAVMLVHTQMYFSCCTWQDLPIIMLLMSEMRKHTLQSFATC